MFALMIIGALPRLGKTFLLRLLMLAAALDPSAELHGYDLKGGPDLLPLEGVSHRFRIGDEPDDLTYLKADVRELVVVRREVGGGGPGDRWLSSECGVGSTIVVAVEEGG